MSDVPLLQAQMTGIESVIPTVFDVDAIELPDGLDIRFFLSPHLDQYDLGRTGYLEGVLAESDICALEGLSWHDDDLRDHNAIAQGDKQRLGRMARMEDSAAKRGSQRKSTARYIKRRNQALFNSGVQVVIPDVSFNDDTLGAGKDGYSIALVDYPNVEDVAFEDGVRQTGEWINDVIFPIYTRRDQYILDHFGPRVLKGIQQSNELTSKHDAGERIAVVTLMGQGHEGVAATLAGVIAARATSTTIATSFELNPDMPVQYQEQAYSRHIRGQEIDELLMAKIATDLMLMSVDSIKKVESNQKYFQERIALLSEANMSTLEQLYEEARTEYAKRNKPKRRQTSTLKLP